MQPIKVYTKTALKALIDEEIKSKGDYCSLNHLDVTNVQDMSWLFSNSTFNGDISQWNVSNVTNMLGMFHGSAFNGDISQWKTGKVNIFSSMFCKSSFDNDISLWDVSGAGEHGDGIFRMFKDSRFSGNLTGWKWSERQFQAAFRDTLSDYRQRRKNMIESSVLYLMAGKESVRKCTRKIL